jgi:tetratricopeptide (TPR) repeat protein
MQKCREIAESWPEHAPALVSYANFLAVDGLHKDQISKACLAAAALKSTTADQRIFLARILIIYGLTDQAREVLKKVSTTDLRYGEAASMASGTFASQGKWVEAENELRAAAVNAPRNAMIQSELAAFLMISGRREDACAAIKRAVEIDPTNPNHIQELARAYRSLGRINESMDQIKVGLKLAEAAGISVSVNQWRAMAEETQTLIDASSQVEPFLAGQAPPEDDNRRLALAELCMHRGRIAEAARLYKLTLRPDREPVIFLDPEIKADKLRLWKLMVRTLASAGLGIAPPPLSVDRETGLGYQSLAGLIFGTNLEMIRNSIDRGNPHALILEVRQLQSLPEFVLIRERTQNLPSDHPLRDDWRKLWIDLDDTMTRLQERLKREDGEAARAMIFPPVAPG